MRYNYLAKLVAALFPGLLCGTIKHTGGRITEVKIDAGSSIRCGVLWCLHKQPFISQWLVKSGLILITAS
jgi:hypothetical protein